jgi:uncharacterized membrane protein YdjX (TVP38/TMEM64 family)
VSPSDGGTDDTPADTDAVDTRRVRVFTSKAARRSALLRLAALVSAILLLTGLLTVFVPELTDPEWLEARLSGLGAFAPAAFVALQAGQVVVAPIPGQVLGGAAGYLFGAVPGAVYSLVGVLIGSAMVFGLSRRYGRPYVEQVVHDRTLAKWDRFHHRTGPAGLFVLFLLPTFPDDLLCFVAGLSDLRASTFLALVAVGRAPSFVAVAYAGTRLSDGRFLETAVVVAALAALSLVVFATKDRLTALLDRHG